MYWEQSGHTHFWPHHPNIFQSTFNFYEFISAFQNIRGFLSFKSPMIYNALLIFDHSHPIIIKVTFIFLKFVLTCINQLTSSIYSWDKTGVPRPKTLCPLFGQHHQKIIEIIFDFPEFYQHTKNQFILLILAWDKASFSVLRP